MVLTFETVEEISFSSTITWCRRPKLIFDSCTILFILSYNYPYVQSLKRGSITCCTHYSLPQILFVLKTWFNLKTKFNFIYIKQ